MSDLETMEAMLTRAGIAFEREKTKAGAFEHEVLTVERGYSGFATEFKFTPDGVLVDIGAYE